VVHSGKGFRVCKIGLILAQRHLECQRHVVLSLLYRVHRRCATDMARHVVAADLIPNTRGALKVHGAPFLQLTQVGGAQSLADDVKAEAVLGDGYDGEAGAVDGDAGSLLHPTRRALRKLYLKRARVLLADHLRDLRRALHDASKESLHATRRRPSTDSTATRAREAELPRYLCSQCDPHLDGLRGWYRLSRAPSRREGKSSSRGVPTR